MSNNVILCNIPITTQTDTVPTNAQVKHDQAAQQDSSKSVKCNVIDYNINYYEFEYDKDFSSTDLKIDNLITHLPFCQIRVKS